MSYVYPVYAGFYMLAGLVFAVLPVRPAILVVVLGGWMLLPVAVYPESFQQGVFPWWITGVALPSDMLMSKAWVAPVTALVWAVLADRHRLRGLRAAPADLALLGFCLWPLLATASLAVAAEPAAGVAALYLAGAWGGSSLSNVTPGDKVGQGSGRMF
jgi:hypothetical protein